MLWSLSWMIDKGFIFGTPNLCPGMKYKNKGRPSESTEARPPSHYHGEINMKWDQFCWALVTLGDIEEPPALWEITPNYQASKLLRKISVSAFDSDCLQQALKIFRLMNIVPPSQFVWEPQVDWIYFAFLLKKRLLVIRFLQTVEK